MKVFDSEASVEARSAQGETAKKSVLFQRASYSKSRTLIGFGALLHRTRWSTFIKTGRYKSQYTLPRRPKDLPVQKSSKGKKVLKGKPGTGG